MFIDNSNDILLRKQRNLPSIKKHPNNLRCVHPSTIINIATEGNIYSCNCPNFLPYIVANVLDLNSFEEFWGKSNVKEIIKTIDERTFDYCDTAMCGIAEIAGDNAQGFIDRNSSWGDEDIKHPKETNIIVGVDDSCNLQCPSCRLYKKDYNRRDTSKNSYIYNEISEIHEHIKNLINKYNHESLIQFGGTGDPFYSLTTVNLISKLEYNPLHRYRFKTNGMSIRAVLPKLKIFPSVESIDFSLDAATKETHEKIRLGSNWDKVINNIKWLSDLPNRPRIMVNFTFQNDNFRELIKFNEFVSNELKVDFISYNLYDQWPHITDEIYAKNAVHLPTHPNYTEAKKLLDHPICRIRGTPLHPIRQAFNISH
jgi:MoaA/NifB/PqqE/SkfB family radical SAM enzyme